LCHKISSEVRWPYQREMRHFDGKWWRGLLLRLQHLPASSAPVFRTKCL